MTRHGAITDRPIHNANTRDENKLGAPFKPTGPPPEGGIMAEPLFLVTSYPIKRGLVDNFIRAVPEWFGFLEAHHPRVLHSAVYVDAEHSEATSVQVHPDAESVEQQFEAFANRVFEWQDYIDPSGMEVLICGAPSDTVLRLLTQMAEAGVAVSVKHPVAGFSRLTAI